MATSKTRSPDFVPYIIVVGNPFDGQTCYGPFESNDDAMNWAERNFPDWLMVRLEDPKSEDFK